MEHLFAYGSLKEKEIQETIFGRLLQGAPETLVGYEIKEISIEEEFGMEQYPIISPTENEKDTIEGMLFQVREDELQKVDTYEGKSYKRIQVEVKSKKTAWVYTATT